MDMQKQLLDPIGTVCKLISLNFNKVKTKISIHGHILTLQEPSSYQPLLRMINGDERNNIAELYYVIVRLIQWYVIESVEETEDLMTCSTLSICNDIQLNETVNKKVCNNTLKKIIKYVCDAFRKLQETYREGNVVLTLQFYINILEDSVEGRFSSNKLPSFLIEQETNYNNFLDYDKIKNLWNEDKLNRICEVYDNCYNVINNTEFSDEIKSHYLEAYIHSVSMLLEASDKEFKYLIQNSKKG